MTHLVMDLKSRQKGNRWFVSVPLPSLFPQLMTLDYGEMHVAYALLTMVLMSIPAVCLFAEALYLFIRRRVVSIFMGLGLHSPSSLPEASWKACTVLYTASRGRYGSSDLAGTNQGSSTTKMLCLLRHTSYVTREVEFRPL